MRWLLVKDLQILRRSPFLLLDSMRTRNLETVQLHRDAHPFTASVSR